MYRPILRTALLLILCLIFLSPSHAQQTEKSIARQWNEQLLAAIRLDEARPTVHARNLYHLSAAMWDAWAAYDPNAKTIFHHEQLTTTDLHSARTEAISYAAHALIKWRFQHSPNAAQTNAALKQKMAALGYDPKRPQSPAANLGQRIANTIIQYGLTDGANEQNNYLSTHYQPVNPSLDPNKRGNPTMVNPDRWQTLHIPNFIGQSGLRGEGYPDFVGPEWGNVKPFSLTDDHATIYHRASTPYKVYLDPGAPPKLNGDPKSRQHYQQNFAKVIEYSSKLDPTGNSYLDISPAARGNNTLGTNDGNGYDINPITNKPYQPLIVPAGDYYRVLAEFWADGPHSETPPGHWFVMLNIIASQPSLEKNFAGGEKELDDLEWDVRAYLTLGGAMHDVAVAAWSNKGWYDFPRPISAIRYLCDQGQSSDNTRPSYNSKGIPLQPNLIELITKQSAAPGERHHHLAGNNNENIGKIAIKSWRGSSYVENPKESIAGVDWIHCGDWWPYQRPSFVTPPFAGYVSGHSTYSRAAAEVLTLITGSKFFPGGLGTFRIPKHTYLKFEKGPSRTLQLQWATYQDAADECSLSRIYGGIHPPIDDIPGRLMGYQIGHLAFNKALEYFPPN